MKVNFRFLYYRAEGVENPYSVCYPCYCTTIICVILLSSPQNKWMHVKGGREDRYSSLLTMLYERSKQPFIMNNWKFLSGIAGKYFKSVNWLF